MGRAQPERAQALEEGRGLTPEPGGLLDRLWLLETRSTQLIQEPLGVRDLHQEGVDVAPDFGFGPPEGAGWLPSLCLVSPKATAAIKRLDQACEDAGH